MPTTVFPTLSLMKFNTLSLANAAHAYADQGIPVFPLVPRAKEPRVPRGFYSATTDLDQIEAWWSSFPHANIGIATGKPSGWWVLDIDPRHGGMRSLEALERHAREWGSTLPLHLTLRGLTGGGGVHLFYQMPVYPGVDPPNGTFAGYEGIELKKAGGYVVAPPSIHPSSLAYQWQQEIDEESGQEIGPAPFPLALLELWVEAQQRAFSRAAPPGDAQTKWREARTAPLDRERDPEYWLHAALRHATPGRRHNYACFLAIQLVSVVGCSVEEAEYWMREYVAQVIQLPSDPYELDDALRCLQYAWQTHAS